MLSFCFLLSVEMWIKFNLIYLQNSLALTLYTLPLPWNMILKIFLQNYIFEANCRLSNMYLTSKAFKYNKCLGNFFHLVFSFCITPIDTKLLCLYIWACFNPTYQIVLLIFYNWSRWDIFTNKDNLLEDIFEIRIMSCFLRKVSLHLIELNVWIGSYKPSEACKALIGY